MIQKGRVPLMLIGVLVCIYGMQSLYLSMIALSALFLLVSRARVRREALLSVVLLLLFCLTYTGILWDAGWLRPWQCFRMYLLPIILSFFVGIKLGSWCASRSPAGIITVLLYMITGMALFSLLSAYLSPTELLETQHVIDMWSSPSNESPGSTVIGLMICPALCLLPILMFGIYRKLPPSHRTYLLVIITLLVLSAAYVSVRLLVRSPLVAGLAATLAFLLLDYLKPKVSLRFKMLNTAKVLVLVILVIVVYSADTRSLPVHRLAERFRTDSLEHGRFERNQFAIETIAEYPWGYMKRFRESAVFRMKQGPGFYYYAHNLWLDVGLRAGVVPMLILALFHAIQYTRLLKIIRRSDSFASALILSCGVAFFMGQIVEPVLQSSTYYFSITCFFFGLLWYEPPGRAVLHNQASNCGAKNISRFRRSV